MSGKIGQTAGRVQLDVWLGGYPLHVELKIDSGSDRDLDVQLNTADLHDLRYCIDRLLAQLGERAR